MKNINCCVWFVISAFIIYVDAEATARVGGDGESDLPDFDFDNEPGEDYYYGDGLTKIMDKSDTISAENVQSTLFGDVKLTDEQTNAFVAKEKRVRAALLRATKDSGYRKKFVQIMPILRSLSKPQRLVLAALVSAQTGSLSGKTELNMAQVATYIPFFSI